MEDDIDIYEDLPSFEARDGEKYKEEIKELSQKCSDFERENAELKLKVAELSKSNQTLSNNLSSLLKTAKAEISRKDRMITELRQQHDNMAFRRGGFKQKPRKPQENYTKRDNFAPNIRQEIPSVESQPISRQESEDEIEEPEQKYEPEKVANTVFGERLRKKILMEQEAERIQKEEARLQSLASQAIVEQVKVEPIAENEIVSDVIKKEEREEREERVQKEETEERVQKEEREERVQKEEREERFQKEEREERFQKEEKEERFQKEEREERIKKEPQEIANNSPAESAPSLKSSALSIKSSSHTLNVVNLSEKFFEEDDRNLSERRELVKKSCKRIDQDASIPESKRRRLDDERHHSDDTRHYNGNFKHESSRSNFEGKDNFRSDAASRLGHRRGSSNREEFSRGRRGGRSKSTHRSRSRTPDRRHVEKRADRHRTDRYRAYMDKCEKRRHSGINRSKDYSGKSAKDPQDLRQRIEQRIEPPIVSRSGYGDYKNSKLDKEEKRRVSPGLKKSRSRSRGSSNNFEIVDKRRTRLTKSPERSASCAISEESSRERKGVKTRSKYSKDEVAERKDFEAEAKLERSSRTRCEKVNNKPASSALQLRVSENGIVNKQLAASAELPDGLSSVGESEETKKQRKGSRRKSKDLVSEIVDGENLEADLKSQMITSLSSEKEVTNKPLVSPAELSESSEKTVTNNQQVSEKEVTNKQIVSSTQSSEDSEKEVTNVFSTQPLSVRLGLMSKSNETPEEAKKGARRKSKDSEDSPTETNSEEKATNKKTPEETKDPGRKSNDIKSAVPEDKNCDSNPKSETRTKGSPEKSETNEKLASQISESEDFPSKVESSEVPIIQNCQDVESAESTTANLQNEKNEVESSIKTISSILENDSEGPSIPPENPAVDDSGSKSFREEKIENIEKFIKNYQDDEDLCCRIAENEEPNDANKSCSSILETLSMDLELDAIGKPDDDALKNSLISEELLLESLSTPVKKNSPPLPPFSPATNEIQQPPLPPFSPPDEKVRPPLPPIPYPEEIMQQSLSPLPPSVEKSRPETKVVSSPDENKQESSALPSRREERKNSSTEGKPEEKSPEKKLPSPEKIPEPPSAEKKLPSPEKIPEPPSAEKKSPPPLPSPEKIPPPPSPDCDDKNPAPVPLLDTKKEILPTLSPPDETKSSSPLIKSPGDKNKTPPPLSSVDDEKKNSTLLPVVDEKSEMALSSPGLEDETKPLLSNEKNDKVSSEVSSSKETNDKLPSEAPASIEKNDKLSSEAPASSEQNEKLSSEAPAAKEKNNELSSEASASNAKNDKLSSEASASKEKNYKPSSEAPDSKEKNDELSSESPAAKEKDDKLASEASAPTDENDVSEKKEMTAIKSQPEKIPLKQISRRHKIPCVPIVSRYSRKRRDMILADSEAARCIVKSDSSSDTETNNNAKSETAKFSHVLPKEPKIILKHVDFPKPDKATLEKSHENPSNSVTEKSEDPIEVSKISASEKESKIESKIPSETSESEKPEKIIPTAEIVAFQATSFNEPVANLQGEAEKNTEASQPEVESEDQQAASSKMRKRSALKTIVPPDPIGDSLGASAGRKRALPKEKENQSRQPEKKCKIMVVARRRRAVHLEDSSTSLTLVSSAQDASCDEFPKNIAKIVSPGDEKPEVAGSVSKGRKRRSADK